MTAHLPMEHEVVHAVGALDRALPSLMEEGAATYWADSVVIPVGTKPSEADLRQTLDLHFNDVSGYQQRTTAAYFVSYLVQRWGVDAYRELHRSSTPTRAEFERTFETVFGTPLAEAIADCEAKYDPDDACDLDSLRSSFHACAREPDAILGEEGIDFDLDVSCANPRVVGPRIAGQGPARIWVDLVVEIVAPGGPESERLNHITFDSAGLEHSESVRLAIRRCDLDCAAVAASRNTVIPYENHSEVGVWVFPLPPGRYVARLSRDATETEPVRFQWR